MFSLRSHADLESFFTSFVFGSFQTLPRPLQFEDVPKSKWSFWSKGKLPIRFCISGNTLSFIAELKALLICACIRFISESISWDNLTFISLDNISIDSASLFCLHGPFVSSMFLISFSWKILLYYVKTRSLNANLSGLSHFQALFLVSISNSELNIHVAVIGQNIHFARVSNLGFLSPSRMNESEYTRKNSKHSCNLYFKHLKFLQTNHTTIVCLTVRLEFKYPIGHDTQESGGSQFYKKL